VGERLRVDEVDGDLARLGVDAFLVVGEVAAFDRADVDGGGAAGGAATALGLGFRAAGELNVVLLSLLPQATRANEASARARSAVTFFMGVLSWGTGLTGLYPGYAGLAGEVQRPLNTGVSPLKKAIAPSRRSSVPMLSAIPWRSSCRCSVMLFWMLTPQSRLDIFT
jgi:hypothetical protein